MLLIFQLGFVACYNANKYTIDEVKEFSDLPVSGRLIKIPGYKEKGMVCMVPDNMKKPKYEGDFSQMFKSWRNRCHQISFYSDQLLFCYMNESKINGISLGNFSKYEVHHKTLHYITNGQKCNETHNYSLDMKMVCDRNVPKTDLDISTFYFRDNCTLIGVLNNRFTCRHRALSEAPFYAIKCIQKDIYIEGLRKRDAL